MDQLQEARGNQGETGDKNKANVPDENLELMHGNTNRQMRRAQEEDTSYTAYDSARQRQTYQNGQKSYNEERGLYTEQVFSSGSPPEQQGEIPPTDSAQTCRDKTSGEWKSPGMVNLEQKKIPGGKIAFDDSLTLGTAETPKMWSNTYGIQKNKRLQEKLEGKRKDVQRAYTQFWYTGVDGQKHSTNLKKRFEYYGRINIAAMRNKNCDITKRLKYSTHFTREKMTKKDYESRIRRKEWSKFKRREKGRLLFRNAKSLVNDESLQEDEITRDMKRTAGRAGRLVMADVRRNVKTIKLQNNVYARLEQAKAHEQVLRDKRGRLISDEKRKQRREAIKEAKSREQKKKLKKQMAQQRVKEEGGFLRRTRQSRMVKKRAKEYRKMVRKRVLSTIASIGGITLFLIILGMILFLSLLALFVGGSHYYASSVTQNDYGTISEATEYFRKLETDMDECLNADRDALEADIESEYGDEIFEFVYNLADFGFSANTLVAYLSAVYGSFTLEDVKEELEEIFNEMYTLTVEVKVEEREVTHYNPDTGNDERVTEPKNICYITLEKKTLEEVVDGRLPDDLRFQFSGYWLSTGGQQVYSPVMREDWTNLISSNYGERIHPITKERKFHNGVDIAVPTGTRIYSAVKGTVILAQYSSSAGNWVKVQTESGWTVIMMHMDSLAVSAGQEVEQGDFLGYSGNTGNSTGPHLHLEVRDANDKTLNPIFIIPQTCAVRKEAE